MSERSDRLGPVRRSMCAGILGLETVALVPVSSLLLPLGGLPTALALTIGIGLPVLCLAGAAMMRGPRGGVVGWVAQVAVVASGVATPWLFGLGLVFLALYAGCWVLGAKIDRERAEAVAAYEAEQAGERTGERAAPPTDVTRPDERGALG
jgi:hypothetical protein